ncbi:TerC family protein [Chelatococcus asaccharovorans]|uniref:YjbE family integral membrane protein n=1 Tax=Chelatococcus asaccharovorans TaxID=28210 RepID=A0A2V3TY33_9HYPH|nr:TerC family protein [Chelatococcus asaccharovorans]MBS7704792.1 TerC family protein [Chelatococcus asaccharovorans]PXW54689.1 YjbE family integral membrane protein [Chelatococcus asaccharovorans]
MPFDPQILLQILQIAWIDLLLSGDNAVVIALACRSLPARQKRVGIFLGAGTAVCLRIIFALIISYLLELPFLRVAGSLLLLWIAVKLAVGEESSDHNIRESTSLWQAVRTIAIADAVMSLDNVVAISAAAHGNPWLFIFGLILSIPLIMVGSTLIMALLERFPIFVWAGALLLGWIAGEMLVSDPLVVAQLNSLGTALAFPDAAHDGALMPVARVLYAAAAVGALFVLAAAGLVKWSRSREKEA